MKLCIDGINIAKSMIKNEKSKIKNSNNRHYQNITGKKKIERNILSLNYIIDYFKEYNLWLQQIKKYKFNKF